MEIHNLPSPGNQDDYPVRRLLDMLPGQCFMFVDRPGSIYLRVAVHERYQAVCLYRPPTESRGSDTLASFDLSLEGNRGLYRIVPGTVVLFPFAPLPENPANRERPF